MNALESPLEALAVNYLAYGFLTAVNNIWAWAAVITAAFSFWRIRSSSPTPVLSSVVAPPTVAEEQPATVSSSEPKEATYKPSFLEREGSTKMKFSLYIEEDGGGDEREVEVDDGGEAAAVISEKWWCDDWEKVMVIRMGDMGWYRWQNTTALDGGVVRLWEGRRRRRRVVGDMH